MCDMWAALKSDISEVISSIKEEGAAVLDDGNPDEVSSTSLSSSGEPTTTTVSYNNDDTIIMDDVMLMEASNDVVQDSTEEITAEDHVALLRGTVDTYLEPLVPWETNGQKSSSSQSTDPSNNNNDNSKEEVLDQTSDDSVEEKQFLEQFHIEEKTEEIAVLLETYPETVKALFETYVPQTVTYQQFWQRYFFRCDVPRVENQWRKIEEEKAERERRRREMIQHGVDKATSIFGGAMKSIGNVIAPTTTNNNNNNNNNNDYEESTFQKYQKEVQGQNQRLSDQTEASPPPPSDKGSSLSFGLFGNTGRLPFVLDTTCSSEEETPIKAEKQPLYNQVNEEEEEEELAWDSEEDDDDDDDDDAEGTVEFIDTKSGNSQVEALLQKENDQLKGKIQELEDKLTDSNKERDSLYETLEKQTKELSELKLLQVSSSSNNDVHDLQSQIQRLQMQLFEKESEHAAMKESLNDSRNDDSNMKMTDKVESLQQELESLKHDVKSRDETILSLQNDYKLQSETTQHAEQEKFQSEKKAMEEKQSLQEATIKKLNAKIKVMEDKNKSLEETSEKLKQQVGELEKKSVKAVNNTTPLTNSSDSKSKPKPVIVSEEDEDDWGDAWGDEDI